MGLGCVKRSFCVRWETGLKSLPAQGSYSFLRTELAPYPLERSSPPPHPGLTIRPLQSRPFFIRIQGLSEASVLLGLSRN